MVFYIISNNYDEYEVEKQFNSGGILGRVPGNIYSEIVADALVLILLFCRNSGRNSCKSGTRVRPLRTGPFKSILVLNRMFQSTGRALFGWIENQTAGYAITRFAQLLHSKREILVMMQRLLPTAQLCRWAAWATGCLQLLSIAGSIFGGFDRAVAESLGVVACHQQLHRGEEGADEVEKSEVRSPTARALG